MKTSFDENMVPSDDIDSTIEQTVWKFQTMWP